MYIYVCIHICIFTCIYITIYIYIVRIPAATRPCAAAVAVAATTAAFYANVHAPAAAAIHTKLGYGTAAPHSPAVLHCKTSMCVCACVSVRERACVRTFVHACVHACLRACVHACTRACMRACVRECTRVFPFDEHTHVNF